MKAGWADTYLPRGFWNLPSFTANGEMLRAQTAGTSSSVYGGALQDMDAGDKLRAGSAQE